MPLRSPQMTNVMFRDKMAKNLRREYFKINMESEDDFIFINSCVSNSDVVHPNLEDCTGIIRLKMINSRCYWLVYVVIHELVRNQGKGTIMLEELIRFADEYNLTLRCNIYPHLGLDQTIDMVWLTQWYQRFGFEVKDYLPIPSVNRSPKLHIPAI